MVGDLNKCEANVLFVILAQPAIIGTTVMSFRIKFQWCFRCLVIISDILVIVHVRCDQHFIKSMLRTILEHIYILVLKNNFRIYRRIQTGHRLTVKSSIHNPFQA